MKKLSKNKMAKLLATFLGASTILTPMVTLISCEQINKTLIVKEKKQEKPQPDPQPQPQPDPQQPQEELDAGSVFELQENGGEFKLTGSICIDDINSAKFIESLKKAEGKNIDTSTFKINCFKTNISSPTGRNVVTTNSATQITAITITPDLLNKLLETGKGFSYFELNNESNNKIVKVLFNSKRDNNEKDYFDISDLAKFNFNKDFELQESSDILVKGGTKESPVTVSELMKLINNEKLKNIKVGPSMLSGNVGEILQKLVESEKLEENKKLEEKEGESIQFYFYNEYDCENPSLNTGYFGKKSGKTLTVEQLNQYYNRIVPGDYTDDATGENYIMHRMQIEDATIENLNSNYKGNFFNAMLTNVNFVNSDLSKIDCRQVGTGHGYLKFENTILPTNMGSSVVNTLILKNAKLPEELKETDPEDLPYRLPNIKNNLKIFNLELLNKWTEADLSTLDKVRYPPEKYVGPKNVWDKFKHLYLDEGTKTHFTNEDLTDTPLENINFSSIQKQQNQLLALLQAQNKSRG